MTTPNFTDHTERINYTDGESLGEATFDIAPTGKETVLNSLGALATSFSRGINESVRLHPDLVAIEAELASTPWIRFRRKRKLTELRSKLSQELFLKAITSSANGLEIVSFQSQSDDQLKLT